MTYDKAQDLCAELCVTTMTEAPTQVWAGTEGEARAVRSKCTASFPDLATSRAEITVLQRVMGEVTPKEIFQPNWAHLNQLSLHLYLVSRQATAQPREVETSLCQSAWHELSWAPVRQKEDHGSRMVTYIKNGVGMAKLPRDHFERRSCTMHREAANISLHRHRPQIETASEKPRVAALFARSTV